MRYVLLYYIHFILLFFFLSIHTQMQNNSPIYLRYHAGSSKSFLGQHTNCAHMFIRHGITLWRERYQSNNALDGSGVCGVLLLLASSKGDFGPKRF